MANFFTRTLDRITPWNRGGELVRRKKREEEDANKLRVQQIASQSPKPQNKPPSQPVVGNTMVPTLKTPEPPKNIFETLNKNLVFNKPKTTVTVTPNPDSRPSTPAKPGLVVKPTVTPTLLTPDGRNVRDIPDTPEVIINRSLDRGESFEDIASRNNYKLEGVKEYANITRPDYGIKLEKPKQSFGNKLRDVFDTNTESDRFRRQEGNKKAVAEARYNDVKPLTLEKQGNIVGRTPVVGHITKTLNTLGAQGAELIPTIEGSVYSKIQNNLSKDMLDAQKRGDKVAYEEAKRKLDLLQPMIDKSNREQDAAHTMFEKNNGGLLNTGTLYGEEGSRTGDAETALKDIALPTAVAMLDLYTLGKGGAIAEGLKGGGVQGLKVAAPDIAKATAGNFGSGALGTYSEGGNTEQAIKSGLLNSLFGLVPDVGLPMAWKGFTNKVVPKFMRTGRASASDVVEELDDAAIGASAEAAIEASRPKPIPVRQIQDIPINAIEGLPENIRVRNLDEPGRLIQEVTGDATTATPNPLIQKLADDAKATATANAAFDQAKTAPKPNPAIEGMVTDPAKIVTTKDLAETQTVLDDYLKVGKITEEQHKELTDQLSKIPAQDAPIPTGAKIDVKMPDTIPVRDNINVPTNLPETPGTVRVTKATAPSNAKSAQVAVQNQSSAPTVVRTRQDGASVMSDGTVRDADGSIIGRTQELNEVPVKVQSPEPIIPKAGTILPDGTKVTKRMVQAARNQRKNATALAKAEEGKVAAMERVQASKTNQATGQSTEFAPTGKFAKSSKSGAYETVNKDAETALGKREMADRSAEDLASEIGAKTKLDDGDARKITEAKDNLLKADPENARSSEIYQILDKAEKANRRKAAQLMALIPRTIRKSASADELVGRWDRKLSRALDDPTKISDVHWKRVESANDAFTTARDKAAQLEEKFRKTGSEADYNAWESAYKTARDADTNAKMVEVSVAQDVLKGQKGPNSTKIIDEMKKEADVNTMDATSAAMLSGTGTGFRNTFGTELMGLENRIGANLRAKVTKAIPFFDGAEVGGFDRKGARFGRKYGATKWAGDAQRRASVGGKNPLEWAKNWSTTINSGGESSLQSQVYSRLGKYYKNQLAEQGVSGKSLDLRMRHAMLTDPDNMGKIYLDAAMKSSGLTGLFQKGQTIEKGVSDWLGGKTNSRTLQGASKLMMRMAVGFPTATGNFLYQSGKRLTLGLPSWIETGAKLAQGDKAGAAMAFDRGLKEAGSGGAMLGLGAALGSAGVISGPYPTDPEERERWEREGISENSIKIGGAWFPIPQGAGMLGLPLMVGAAIGSEDDNDDALKRMFERKNLAKLLPTDQIQGFLNTMTGDESPQALKNMMASTVRASTPVGALLNQIAKSFDPTKNDTTQHGLFHNVLDQVISGIPGVNNMIDIADKTDSDGNPIENPNGLQLAFGATSKVQGGGEQRSAEIDAKVKSALEQIDQYGLLSDSNLDGVLEGSALEAYEKANKGKKLDESDVKALKDGLVKGVSAEGTDTAYLEKEQYDTNLAVLKMKRDLMNEDKTTKPSSLKDIDNAIKRGEVYKKDKVPYELISELKSVSVDDWRKMGVGPEDEDYDEEFYDPEMYQKLWDLDRKLTEAGVSLGKNLDKPKYTVKKKKKGSGGGSGQRNLDTSFGRLKDGAYSPKVQEYAGIDAKSGSIPIIRTVRPNIVHKIGSSR